MVLVYARTMNIQSTRKTFPTNNAPVQANGPLATIKVLSHKALDTVDSASCEVDKRPVMGKVFAAAGAGVRSLKAFPSIIYPTIYNATSAEKAQILQSLDGLPLHQVSGVRSISMVPEIASRRPGWTVNGRAFNHNVTNRIELSRSALQNPEKFHRTLVHEVGHTVDYETQTLKLFGERSTKEPFGEGPHITEYAKTNHKEDFAESYEEFHLDPEHLKEKVPEKYEAVEDLHEPSFMQRLVDRKEFRETGKYMSEAFGASEISRHSAEVAYYASSVLQGVHGVSQWVRSASSGDALGHASGVLNTATGLALASGISPMVGMSFQGANQALQSAVKRGRLSAEEVESTITLPVRPIEALFGRETAKIEKEHRPGKVLAVAAGGAVGGTAGSLIGPYLGVIGGYHLAGGLGGVVGLVAGGMLGFVAGAEVGGRLGGRLAGLHHPKQSFYQKA